MRPVTTPVSKHGVEAHNDIQQVDLHRYNSTPSNNPKDDAQSPQRKNTVNDYPIPVHITNKIYPRVNRTKPFQKHKGHVRKSSYNDQQSYVGSSMFHNDQLNSAI